MYPRQKDNPEMTEFMLYKGTPHPLNFAGERESVSDVGSMPHVPRAEVMGDKEPVSHAWLELEGMNVPVPLHEVSFGKIDQESARALGGMAAHELVVVSRLAERGAALAGVRHGFAHPSYMERDAQGRIVQAHVAAVPQPVVSYADVDAISPRHVAPMARRIINCMPEDMMLGFGGNHVTIPRHPHQPWLDPEYRYEYLGQSVQGVNVAATTIQEVRHVPSQIPGDMLLLAHTEAVLEAARTGVDPEIVSRMVFAVGLGRGPEGFQGNVCTGLGYYSPRTLKRYLSQVGF